jgi:hypothetical protein
VQGPGASLPPGLQQGDAVPAVRGELPGQQTGDAGLETGAEDDAVDEVRVVLPEGIAPADVTLDEAPKGWQLKATDDGYVVGGTPLKTGVDAEYKVRIRQLPDVKEVAFKTIDTYSDGEVSRWIELPKGGEEPEQPVPLLKLKAAAPGAKPISPRPTASPTPSPTPSVTATPSESGTTAAAADTKKDDDGSSTGLVVGGVVALLVLGAGAWWLMKRRASAAGS